MLRRFVPCAVAVVLVSLSVGSAHASTSLGVPTGAHALDETSTSFTIGLDPASGAEEYRIYASTTEANIYVTNILAGSSTHNATSTSPELTISGLTFSSATYYYRIESLAGSSRHFGAIETINLRPDPPTSLSLTASSSENHLLWHSGPATGFAIAQGTDPTITNDRVNYVTQGQAHVFSPYGMTAGRTYYFRVAAINGSVKSHYSNLVSATITSHTVGVSVMTYNILEASSDGTPEGGTTVAPWSQRGPAAANLIYGALPDVVAIQEGAAFIGPATDHVREVDSLSDTLGYTYTLAQTEIRPGQPHAFRTGVYILYRNRTLSAVGRGGYWTLPYSRYAAYQVLQNKATGAKFLFVSTHLVVGSGATYDAQRQKETEQLISYATSVASAAHVPIVYAGDYNSDVTASHAFDGPSVAMTAVHAVDGYPTAQSLSNAQYNSSNQYLRTPPASYDSIDHVYTTQGIGVVSWGLLLDLSGGQFVGTIPSDHNPLLSQLTIPY